MSHKYKGQTIANYKRLFLANRSYFITIVTHKRNRILIENISLLRESFVYAKNKFEFEIEAIVILPDHIHMIINPSDVSQYPYIISSIKRYFSQRCDPKYYAHMVQSSSREDKGYIPVWQKRYYEHTIKDERDFWSKVEYIHANPLKHEVVESLTKWKYSSFDKYIKMGYYDTGWGNEYDMSIDME